MVEKESETYSYTIEECNNRKWTTISGVINLAVRNHENDIIRWIRNNVKRTDLFLDIGANVGCISINLFDHFKNIITIEPQKVNLFALRNNIKINDIQNIVVIDKAVWEENKKIYLLELSANDFSGMSRTSDVPNLQSMKTIEIDAITVDSLDINPSFVKIDIEGAEMMCLRGMKETIKRSKPILLIEIHKCYGVNSGDIINYLKQFGYREKLISQNSDVFYYVFEQ